MGVIYIRTVRVDGQINSTGECKMKMPTTISGWCLWLFFLWYGLGAFIPALMAGIFPMVGGILALGYAVFALLGR
jgi:purine-cytosine permease-like protein